jgi:broad specificity phosphatase PhoE
MLLLIRHALVDACGRYLAGRQRGIHLNAGGRLQAAQLGRCLATIPLRAIYSSPMERAIETALAVAGNGRSVTVAPDLNEIDFGQWTGVAFEELDARPEWRAFNASRSSTPIPGGERMANVQARAFRCVMDLHRHHPGEVIAIVSHGDVLRSIVARVIGTPLDKIGSFEIDPASISVLGSAGNRLCLNLLNGGALDFEPERYGIPMEATCVRQ